MVLHKFIFRFYDSRASYAKTIKTCKRKQNFMMIIYCTSCSFKEDNILLQWIATYFSWQDFINCLTCVRKIRSPDQNLVTRIWCDSNSIEFMICIVVKKNCLLAMMGIQSTAFLLFFHFDIRWKFGELECLFIIESYCWSYDGNKFVDTNLIGINSPWNGNLAWRKSRNLMKIIYTDANRLITIFQS